MIHPAPVCFDQKRKTELIGSTLNAIDYVELSADQTTLRVTFLNDLPADCYGWSSAPDCITIEGGSRITGLRVMAARRVTDRMMEFEVSSPGDFSTYTLVIDSAALDPMYARVEFSFKAACPNRFNCRPRTVNPCESIDEPLIDYMAKDYASFRQALLDYLSMRAPEWRERHAADLGMTLVELLSYAADQISYFHDAVSNEAYLETARQRVSVRRHARLIDYVMHDGVSARVFFHFKLVEGTNGTLPADTPVFVRLDRPLGTLVPPFDSVLPAELVGMARDTAGTVFETMFEKRLDAKLNTIGIYTWDNETCCLPRGARCADLGDDYTAYLQAGDFLLFEEVLGSTTGTPGEADPNHRQIVRLTRVESDVDPRTLHPITRVEWGEDDALRLTYRLSLRQPDGSLAYNVSVARGNLVLADHGKRVEERYPEDPEAVISVGARPYRCRLLQGPLSFRIPIDTQFPISSNSAETTSSKISAAALFRTNALEAKPQIVHLKFERKVRDEWVAVGDDWQAVQPDLFASSPYASHFVVETDNDGCALIRFGDNVYGQSPPTGCRLRATYRVGIGIAGNIGADSMAHVIYAQDMPQIDAIRNPLPAWGGTEPETLDQVKKLAPAAFRAVQYRAVTEADYAWAAETCPLVSKAVARMRWTGSWLTVFLSIDPHGREGLTPDLSESVRQWVTRYALAGYDLEIQSPIYVPLELELQLCIDSGHFRGDVEQAVLMKLDNRIHSDGSRGFFHPDEFTFGDRLYLSRLYEAVLSVPGVISVWATRFRRLDVPDDKPLCPQTRENLKNSYIPIGDLEILRLDNDPSFSEHGMLQLTARGGK